MVETSHLQQRTYARSIHGTGPVGSRTGRDHALRLAGCWVAWACCGARVGWCKPGLRRWAFAGGMLVALHSVSWPSGGDNYFGAAPLRCSGGELMCGGLARMIRSRAFAHGLHDGLRVYHYRQQPPGGYDGQAFPWLLGGGA